VLNEVSNTKVVVPQPTTAGGKGVTTQGEVSLTILPPPQRDSATGHVTLTILEPE